MIYFDDTFYSFVKKELKSQNVSFLNLNFSAKNQPLHLTVMKA